MNRQTAEAIHAACDRLLSELNALERDIGHVEDQQERSRLLQGLGATVAGVLALRSPAIQQFPELETPEELGEPDTSLDAQEQAVAAGLTDADVELIDRTLVSECAQSWRKVARVVGFAMKALSGRFGNISDGYFAQRVCVLAADGWLEAQGNVHYMRFSEVRLPQE